MEKLLCVKTNVFEIIQQEHLRRYTTTNQSQPKSFGCGRVNSILLLDSSN